MSSFLLVGCGASGHTMARQPRSTGYMPETCRKGRPLPISASTASLRRSFRQKSHSRGLRSLDQPRQRERGAHVGQRVVRGLVRQAVGRGEVLELERGPLPSSCVGHSMPSGRSA